MSRLARLSDQLGSTARRWSLIAGASLLILAIYTVAVVAVARQGLADKTQAVVTAKVEKAQARETGRRVETLREVQVRFKGDLAELARLRADRKKLLEEIDRASRAHDGDACLGADGVRRLAALGAPAGGWPAGD